MLRKRTILFIALILLSLVMSPASHARAHTNPEGVIESARNRKDSYSVQASTNAYEPDNTAGQAKLINNGLPQTRSIVPKSDVDWIRFQLSTTSGVILETSGPLKSDTRIYLYSGNLTELERNDDDGTDFYSYIDRTCSTDPLPAGTYFVKVEEYLKNAEIQSYNLAFDASPCPAEQIDIFMGGAKKGTSLLTFHKSIGRSFPGVNTGPVKIVNTGPTSFMASERMIYKVNNVNTSFSEMMALPNSQLDVTYYLPWYNNVNLDTQLRIANVSASPASVTVFIGGAQMPGTPFSLAAGASTQKSFAGINNGPVRIVSNQNIVAAERVIYKVNNVNTSFTEMMALPNSQLNSTFWFPWYNNSEAVDTQLRIANVSASPATVRVYIANVEMTGSPFSLAAGASTQKSFAGINNGPVKVESNVLIVAAERLLYKVNNVPTSFSEMMGLPNHQLDLIFWLPWYNNVSLDTQLRFGLP